jgi:hypothetical protein
MGRRGPAGPVCSEPRPNGPSRTCRSGLLRATLRFRPPAKCQSPADRLTGLEWQPDGGTIAVRPFCVRLDASKVTKVTGSEVTARKSPNRGAPSPPGRAASALTPQQVLQREPFASSCSSSALRCAPARAAFTSQWHRVARTRTTSSSSISDPDFAKPMSLLIMER